MTTAKAVSKGRRAGAKPNKAEDFRRRQIVTPACRLGIYAAQDSRGKYYGSFSIDWSVKSKTLAQRTAQLTPSRTKKFDNVEAAEHHAMSAARDFVERLRLNRVSDDELDAIEHVESRIDQELNGGPSSLSADDQDGTKAAGGLAQDNRIDLAGFVTAKDRRPGKAVVQDRSVVTLAGEPRIRLPWPIEKLNVHPLNRELDRDQVARLRELLEREGQRDAIECRVPPAWWHTREDRFCVPEGHVQILRGAHRWQAAQELGWDEVEVVIRGDVADDQAERILARSDDQRAWSLIEKGRLAEAMRERGLTLDEIATEFQVGDKGTVSHWLGLVGLPECWQRMVEPGMPKSRREGDSGEASMVRLPASWLRPLEKYPRVLQERIFDAFRREELDDIWSGNEWTNSKSDFSRCVRHEVEERLGPVDPSDKPFGTYVSGGNHKSYGRLFELTPEIEQQLEIVEVEIGEGPKKKTVRRAMNMQLFEKLQRPLIGKLRDGKIDVAGRPIVEKGKGKGKKKAAEIKETAAQRKAREQREAAEAAARKKEQDRLLKEKIAAWCLRFLRCLAAQACKPGDWRVTPLLVYLSAAARRQENKYRFSNCPLPELIEVAVQPLAASPAKRGGGGRRRGRDGPTLELVLASLRDEREDETAAGQELECRLVQLILWPQSDRAVDLLVAGPGDLPRDWRPLTWAQREKLKPVELLAIDPADVERIAALLEVSPAAGWKRSGRPKTVERALVTELLELHSREQLDRLAREVLAASGKQGARRGSGCGPAHSDVSSCGTKAEAVEKLLSFHTAAAPVNCPKWLK